ncbi:DUF6029 family protein [Pontibacter sp. G13]|uniref:DUF6029 family protein n=1 Tax=Pontibacter sp. G13 TaxID=3074898 RepID=UPI00288B17DE|nr:DUF6029 family protein [Pontibacter sp. G13]WNJ16631.1 DUF6029 family protein [Pontibacter sp. G13]
MHRTFRVIFRNLLCWICCMVGANGLMAQNVAGGTISGSFQTDVQYLFPDSIIGAEKVDENILSNSFLQLTYRNGGFTAGLRYEAYLNPLLGFDPRFEGQGIANRFASYSSEHFDVTVGNIYDQFGNGIVFRSYQEWTLGIDNSVDGVAVRVRPTEGVTLKGILGKQRFFWERGEGIVRGADGELNLNQLIPSMAESKTRLVLGGSVVSKFEKDEDSQLQLPENVTAFSGRLNLTHGGLNINGEYAYKINDPNSQNDYVYNPGNALYLNATYSRKGFAVIASAKRIDNFDFRSQREVTFQELTLNFLPPTSRFHTYRLPTLYPYATQFNGEVGFSTTLLYKIPKKTKLGGKYGTQLQLNYSRINGLDKMYDDPPFTYETSFLGDPQKLYFQDLNFEINRKWNKKLRTILTGIWMQYNQDVVELGIESDSVNLVDVKMAVLEVQYRVNRKTALRGELQYMGTPDDRGSWAMALIEASFSPHWYITIFDEYNYGNPVEALRAHYYNGSVAYNFGATRIGFSYSRQRRGLLCVGGICREVPASNGFGLNITSSF